jgi:hypothetical protein
VGWREKRGSAPKRNGVSDAQRFEAESPFEWTVVVCSSREAAEAEATLRQATESPLAEWIFLQVDGEWVAKRTPADPALYPPQPPERLWSKLLDRVLDILGTST